MDSTYVWSLPLAVAVIGATVVTVVAMRSRRASRAPSRKAAAGAVDMVCTVCQRHLAISKQELVALSPSEMALAVRIKPAIAGRRLAEYVCPYCEAAHCFLSDQQQPVLVGTNLYQPQAKTAHCLDCGKPLRSPPWPKGQYDGHVGDAPHLQPDYGVVCKFCGSVVCIECAQRITRTRTPDGSFTCARCRRSPVDTFFYL